MEAETQVALAAAHDEWLELLKQQQDFGKDLGEDSCEESSSLAENSPLALAEDDLSHDEKSPHDLAEDSSHDEKSPVTLGTRVTRNHSSRSVIGSLMRRS